MVKIDVPDFEHKFTKKGDAIYIFDITRKKHLLFTPEEWVRQRMIHWLHIRYGYPYALMQTERGIYFNKMKKRIDLVVYRNNAPYLLVECKASHIELSQDTLLQASQYVSIYRPHYFSYTNGVEHHIFQTSNGQWIPVDQYPNY